MSAVRKLFLAAALIGFGLGVAYLLGEPVNLKPSLAPIVSRARSAGVEPAQLTPSAAGAPSLQLVPESNPAEATSADIAATFPVDTKEPMNSQFAPIQKAAPVPAPADPAPSSIANLLAANHPRTEEGRTVARLRNEAPRPIGNEPRSPATIRRNPQPELPAASSGRNDDDVYRVAPVPPPLPATPILPAGYSATSDLTKNASAVYDVSNRSPQLANVSPPPWIAEDEQQAPRMHVIIDGDSLEKLAARYLGDPRRGAEIYEFNRELLASPDVLPLGIELRIPNRQVQSSWDRKSGALHPAAGSRLREAARNNLVPIRSANMDDSLPTPRAQLMAPIRAE